MSEISINRKIQHLYWRAGFGPHYSLTDKNNLSVKSEVDKLFSEAKTFKPLDVVGERKVDLQQYRMMDKDEKKEMRKEGKHAVFDIAYQWILRGVRDEQTLREKMVFFWSCHFACRINDPWFAEANNNTIRKYALGKFGDLLSAVSKDGAMLQFLNNNQNRKQHPNENFAREVMELFTLGRGNYTEQDVKEGARAFTGWSTDKEGTFIFRDKFHDYGTKTFFGKTGNFNGDDILNMILEKKQCAKFITAKIYKFFVNDEPDENIIHSLSESFYSSGYDIEKLMREIFSAGWFYEEKNIGIKIKSPIELLTGLMKNFDIIFENEMFYAPQHILGQELFRPPNVSGWPGGKNWINNSTLMSRLFLARKLMAGAELNMKGKEAFDVKEIAMDKQTKMDRMEKKNLVRADMTGFITAFSKLPDDKINDSLTKFLIQADASRVSQALLNKYSNNSDKTSRIKSMALDLVSLPEYQLC